MKKKELLIGVGVVLIMIMSFYVGMNFGKQMNDDVEFVSAEEAGIKAQSFVRGVVEGAENAVVLDVVDEGSLYKVTFDWAGDGENVFDVLVSKDGKYLIPDAFDLNADITPPVVEDVDPVVEDVDFSGIELSNESINVLYFWGDGCPYCDVVDDFLVDFEARFPDVINVVKFETWNDVDNAALLGAVSEVYGDSVNAVPKLFVGDKVFVGASDEIFADFEDYVFNCLGTSDCDLLI